MNKPKGFDSRLEHSISLLQKAEKLAMMYDAQDGFHLAFSGGKDSQCIYHVAKMAGVRFRAHMSLTSVDPPEVIRFVKTQYPDVVLKKPKDSIYNLAVQKGLLPTRIRRWCCGEYKEGDDAGKVVIIGIRHAESSRRAKRTEIGLRSRKFNGTFEGFEQYREKVTGKSSTTTCISGKDSILVSPIIEWSEADVWYFLNEVAKVPHCCLYDEGFKRIGCICCPMANKKNFKREEARWPHVKRRWLQAIAQIQQNRENNQFRSPEEEYEYWQSKENLRKWLANKRQQTTISFDE